MGKAKSAVEKFKKGLNCSQCVLLTFSENLGLDKELALKIASGFGGGICQGEVCGAIMALNLKYGNTSAEDSKAKEKIYHLVRAFSEEFKNKNGSIKCNDLVGIDLKKEANRALAERTIYLKKNVPIILKTQLIF